MSIMGGLGTLVFVCGAPVVSGARDLAVRRGVFRVLGGSALRGLSIITFHLSRKLACIYKILQVVLIIYSLFRRLAVSHDVIKVM